MIDTHLIEKFYSKIFSVPKKRISVTLGFLSIILASYLNGVSGKEFFIFRYFFLGLALILVLIAVSRVLKSGFNDRRVFFFALFLLIIIESADAIAIHIFDAKFIILSPSAISFILTVVLFFTSESFSFLAAFLVMLVIYPVDYLYSFNAPNRFELYAISSLIGIFLGYVFIRYLDRNVGRINIAKIVRSLVLYWLKNDPKIFEDELINLAEKKMGRVFLIKLGDVKIFAPEFHPGPFRDVGGAKLVEECLKRYDLFLHAVSDHSSNPATIEDVRKIVNTNLNLIKAKAKKPFCVEGDNFKLKIYPFDKFNLIIIHGIEMIDDFPSNIRSLAEKFFENPVVVDAHNAHKEGYEISTSDILEIYSLFERASKVNAELCKEFRISFKKADYSSDAVCGKVALALMKFDEEVHGILMVDSNNMERELRDGIEKLCLSLNAHIDVITTDNHSKTGISPKIGYKPAGIKDFKFIRDFLIESFENAEFKNPEIYFGFKDVEANVMGKRFFKEAETALKNFGEKALYLFFLFSILSYIVSFILGLAFI